MRGKWGTQGLHPTRALFTPLLLTSLVQADMMWVLGVRKWMFSTTTQVTTTAVTSSMMKSRYL